MLNRQKILLAAVVALALAVPAPALAQSPATSAYGGQGGEVTEQPGGGGPAAGGVGGETTSGGPGASGQQPGGNNGGAGNPTGSVVSGDSDNLAFTGLDVTLLILGGLGLLGLGLGIRRLSRPRA